SFHHCILHKQIIETLLQFLHSDEIYSLLIEPLHEFFDHICPLVYPSDYIHQKISSGEYYFPCRYFILSILRVKMLTDYIISAFILYSHIILKSASKKMMYFIESSIDFYYLKGCLLHL